MNLSNAEEQLMNLIWEKGKAFMKDILESYPEPKPASTTVATLLKRLQEKGAISFEVYGNSREYFPLVEKSDYFSKKVNVMIKDFFNDSPAQFASFFAKETALNTHELEALKNIIEEQLKSQKP
ncbi:BlaI/MecI/CopY family transcriptional regulator [Arthrospiribacter ruber]|uniref:BlaI/MecI/CopY family transcriptional regulator n=1 Tax=Arthrospiribacter ruber TaxID=2487934 RepID=A0A951IZR7_9BACT|nr:BlaI/MecI/CopY family transcriptional regulator [Arthrospiribacter ruber]MBW3468363.1 BlaI/MecI/CopY family transcriptional regulator [Arthrospiribacter ruber]